MKKSILIVTIFLGSLLVGCSKENQKNSTDSQVMKRAEATELLSGDISLATDTVSHTALYNTYEGLYRLGSSNEVTPAGATKLPQVSKDGRKYTIELNKNSKWSDDKPVTAKDYVFSWQRTVDPQTESQYAQLFSNIKNAKKIMTKELKPTELGIKAIDDYKLEIELESATPYFQNLLAFPNFFPQREDIVKKYGSEYATTSQKAVYNGAFTLTNYDTSSGGATKWTYEKNKNYWDRSKVKLDKIENTVVKDAGTAFAMYESGKLDETYLLGEYVNQNKGNKEVISILKPSTYYLQFNMIDKDSLMSNKEVRQAVSSITNKKEIVENILNNGSKETSSFVPKGVYYNPDTGEDFSETYTPKMEYNIKNGVDTWNKVTNNQKMEIKLLIPDDDGIKRVAAYLQESYQNNLNGLSIKIDSVPAQVYFEKLSNGDFDITISGWVADYPDGTAFLNNFTETSEFNFGKYNNKDYDKLIEQVNLKLGNEPIKRWDKLVQANQILLTDEPIVPLFQQAVVIMRKTEFKKIEQYSFGTNFDFKNAEKIN